MKKEMNAADRAAEAAVKYILAWEDITPKKAATMQAKNLAALDQIIKNIEAIEKRFIDDEAYCGYESMTDIVKKIKDIKFVLTIQKYAFEATDQADAEAAKFAAKILKTEKKSL